MTEPDPANANIDVDQFFRDQIDTVPHLEALLLFWNNRPRSWSIEKTAERLFLSPEETKGILADLARKHLIETVPGSSDSYRYQPQADRDRLIGSVDATYRRELIRVSRLIHSKPSAAVRAFAQAFRVKKERD